MASLSCRTVALVFLLLFLHFPCFSLTSAHFNRLAHRPSLLRSSHPHGDLLKLDMHALHLDDEDAISSSQGILSIRDGDGEDDNADSISSSQGILGVRDVDRTPDDAVWLADSFSCDPTYGVMPCTDTIIGNLFLVVVYGLLLFVAAKMMSDGSELLLTILDPGLIGGLVLPILGALPDSILIMVSGLGGSTSEAQDQVLVGMGLLAGSIVMLLTLLWGTCLILGRCDLKVDENTGRLRAVDKQLSKSFGLTDTGIEVDDVTQFSARIMIICIIPFIIAQLPRIFGFSATKSIAVLIACILALAGLLAYCLYEVFTPWLQQRRKEIAERRVLKFVTIEKLTKYSGVDRVVDNKGNLNETRAKELFSQIDRNHDGSINFDELQVMLSLSMIDGQRSETLINHVMEEFDENENQQISMDEFLKGMQKWCSELKIKEKTIEEYRQDAQKYSKDLESSEQEEDDNDDDDGNTEKAPPSKKQIIRKAILLLLGGTILVSVFADPLVDAVDAFSTSISIPSFFVSFVLLPIASTSSEAVSSIMFSARKKKKNFSLTYSQIYGAVTMNSTMGLGIFLAVVYARGLEWDFSSEVMIIVVITLIMGLLGSFRKVIPVWLAGPALFLYPLSLGLVAVMDYVLGWQ